MTKTEFLKQLGNNIAQLRIKKGFSQAEFARNCDKDAQSLNRLEKGRINPSIFYLREISIELGISLSDIFSYDSKENEK